MNYFDAHGWLSATEITGRSTDIAPPTHGDKVVGQPYPNWTGRAWVMVDYVEPVAPTPIPQPTVRRLSKLGFVGRLGADFQAILVASKSSVDIEMFVRMLDWATPEADGTSVDLDDPRVIGALQAIEAAGVIATGRAAEILA